MKKDLTIVVSSAFLSATGLVIGILISCFCVVYEQDIVEIKKNEIVSNMPFAGTINDVKLTTKICSEYWLEPNKQPEVAVFKRSLSVVGFVIKVERVN